MDLGLQGRTVVVTGASGGIGRHVAAQFGAEGADVVVTYRESKDDAARVAEEIGGRALVVRYDQTEDGAAEGLRDAVLAWTGRVDVLVNNAVTWSPPGPGGPRGFEHVPDDAWLETVRANVEGAVRLTRAVAPTMRAQRWGRLVHLSSSLVRDGDEGTAYYATAKSALHGFSRSVAFALGREGDILSNVVLPGLTRTVRNAGIVEAFGEATAARAPLGRLLEAREVATAIVYLGSAANTGITGQEVAVTGGA
ncbi:MULTISPECIES: SDR family NAD(P)-dependent oxidoreductase [unclassified Isoptericola]|uniref:SDR family NAD(P)-dependent oxidoreductase n=1 Tax=unclassified Isoptericola TaxID=2623355 RepID=UPI0036662B13